MFSNKCECIECGTICQRYFIIYRDYAPLSLFRSICIEDRRDCGATRDGSHAFADSECDEWAAMQWIRAPKAIVPLWSLQQNHSLHPNLRHLGLRISCNLSLISLDDLKSGLNLRQWRKPVMMLSAWCTLSLSQRTPNPPACCIRSLAVFCSKYLNMSHLAQHHIQSLLLTMQVDRLGNQPQHKICLHLEKAIFNNC